MACLKDIAEQARLSINTVSRAIRGRGYVSAAAREKVMQLVAELGYRPNRAARNLRFRKNFEIAALSPLGGQGGDQLLLEKFVGIKRRLAGVGYEMNLHFMDARHGPNLKLLEEIAGQEPDGVIMIGDSDSYKASYRLLEEQGIPAILISYDVEPDMDCVYIDRQQGVGDAVHYLAERGRRAIAFAGASGKCCNRLRGYRKAVAELGLKEIIFRVGRYGQGELEQIFDIGAAMAGNIRRAASAPDAVIAYSDYLAAGLLAGFLAGGVAVPEAMAVVGFDNRELAAFTSPGLTTIAQPNLAAGELAAEMLLHKIAHPGAPAAAVGVPMTMKIRKST